LHYWGASFIVVGAVVHMARVFLFGSYKAPREVTWLTGVVLLLLILGFSLSGYLLPWDQKAYWATTVTINVARATPFFGDQVANVMRGGSELGALTLGRWYSAHVFLLPAALVLFVVAHVLLMRKHGISGPIRPQEGPPLPFFPWQVMKDTVMMAAVFALLITVVVAVPAHLDEIANPADAAYVPRPEWYFLSLFQLLKYFPGPLEPVATMVLPGLVVGFLFALPFLDRGGSRHPFSPSRRLLAATLGVIGIAVVALTVLGLRDMPVRASIDDWGPRSIAGHELVNGETNRCARCHVAGGPAAELAYTRITKDEEWLLAHMADPVALAPGVRATDDPAPPPQATRFQAQSIVAYLRRTRAGSPLPELSPEDRLAATTFSTMCVGCHKIAGEGGDTGPDLSQIGQRREAAAIRDIIVDPTSEFGDSIMPAYGERLTEQQMDALAQYLAKRR
ncbi:MAG: cytochrome b N-terminal domain-containing protein, partial [Acidobacteria bacterium]|nr:cytochrome b N-terminal domain-containing protein [Acidobacteriota bacterium]